MAAVGPQAVFQLPINAPACLARHASLAARALERLLGLSELDDIYARICAKADGRPFPERALSELRVNYRVPPDELARIPRTGPLLVVANHPFGGIEGLALAALLKSVRPDVKIMANHLLGRISQLRDLLILVDPYARADSVRENVRPMRCCLKWLESGGALAVFPAGDVAHLDRRALAVTERPWSPMIARLARRARCTVLPVLFDGRNSALFQVLGLIHPRLRTALLPRELLNKQGGTLHVRVGRPIPASQLARLGNDEEAAQYLRQRTLLLRRPTTSLAAPGRRCAWFGRRPPQPHAVAPPTECDVLAREIGTLPAQQMLIDAGEQVVYVASAQQVPQILQEIGRLRELTFRAAGEGTGRALDIDEFDGHYQHLFVWNRATRQIVGAYRLGESDTILRERGPAGFYTHSLFEYSEALIERMKPAAIELGRSFVRQEYQRSYGPLLLLWRAIARYVYQRPRLRFLFGAVSISATYQPLSQQLMVNLLRMHHGLSEYEQLVSPRMPFCIGKPQAHDVLVRCLGDDTDAIDDLVSDLESDRKGMPVLVRQYLRLGARFIAFNVDRSFGNCVDGLMVVDLVKTEPRTLARYMGKTEAQRFRERHAPPVPAEARQ